MVIDRDNLLAILYEEVPEFKETKSDFFDEFPMTQIENFEEFLFEEIMKSEASEELIKRSVNFFNKMADYGTGAVIDILTTGVFMSAKYRNVEYNNLILSHLNKNAIKHYESIKNLP